MNSEDATAYVSSETHFGGGRSPRGGEEGCGKMVGLVVLVQLIKCLDRGAYREIRVGTHGQAGERKVPKGQGRKWAPEERRFWSRESGSERLWEEQGTWGGAVLAACQWAILSHRGSPNAGYA